MKKKSNKVISMKTRNFEYPKETRGSKIARKVRTQANGLSDAKRQELFNAGMRMIYGGDVAKEVLRT